jgi:hypothetical protein
MAVDLGMAGSILVSGHFLPSVHHHYSFHVSAQCVTEILGMSV